MLILGFGLGAMAGFVLRQRPAARITGIEPDSALHHQAKQHFGDRVELLCAAAEEYLSTKPPSEPFDLVIDDCFEMQDGEPRRPTGMNESATLLSPWLTARGVLVRNLLPEDGTVAAQTRDLQQVFSHRMLRRFREWENVLVLASAQQFPSDARQRLRPRLRPAEQG